MRDYLNAISRLALGSVATAMLSSCSTLPKAGPDASAIRAQAAVYAPTQTKGPARDYFLVDITGDVASYFSAPPKALFSDSFARRRTGAPNILIGVGDVIAITIFESTGGGLFIPAEGGNRQGNYITLPAQTVDSRGWISVPYAGRVKVSGLSPADVQAQIESRLKDRAIEPQVVVTVTESRSSEVSVLGSVNTPSKFAINPSGERILDAISQAGGISSPPQETYVTLQRDGRTATLLFAELLNNSRENIFVLPDDVIFVDRDRRTFVAFGASGTNGRIDFEESNLTLAEAIGKAQGLLDERADPAQVFIYRFVTGDKLQSIGLPGNLKGEAVYPVIFRLNLRDPGAFFLTQRFEMQDKDILYIDNAKSVELEKVFKVFSTVTTSSIGTSADVRTLTRSR